MKAGRIRVLCVEDNDLVADAIERKLAGDPRFTWLGWVGSLSALREKAQQLEPHVVVLDQDIPGEDTLEMIRTLRREAPDVRVMILTGHGNQEGFERAVDAGAWGYISKAEDSRFIVEAICSVAGGTCVFDAELLARHRAKLGTTPVSGDAGQSLPRPDVRRGLFGILRRTQ